MTRILKYLLLLAAYAGLGAPAFEPPDADARRQAIGPTESLPPPLRAALEPGADFLPVPKPGPDDWLARHLELPQTFRHYESSFSHRPDPSRPLIYLLPLGEFPTNRSPSLELLRRYAAVFFQMEVKLLPAVTVTSFVTRLNPHTQNRQVLAPDVLGFLAKRLPEDGCCMLGITMDDLYPDPKWNFVSGLASLRERVGVFSFARSDPTFYGGRRPSDFDRVLLGRSCKIVVHETAHMFGLTHCVFFHCAMNGSNSVDERDRHPFHLCPVCLRKLQWNAGWDVAKREEMLAAIYREFGFADEARWSERRLKRIRDAK